MLLAFLVCYAEAHDEAPVWTLETHDLAELNHTIETKRVTLLTAILGAIEDGVDTADTGRPYRFDSNDRTVDIPRGVLNRVILSSLDLEIATTEKYVFCESGCDESLAKDFVNHPQKSLVVRTIRHLWPKVKSSFAILWKDIPLGVWTRMIHAARYSRHLQANILYQSKAYGKIPMAFGAIGFASAFSVTEIAETLFMGPVHFVCKANYFWSVAFGSAIASLSRDLRTLILFDKNNRSLAERGVQAFSQFRSIRSTQRLEKRILFHSLAEANGLDTTAKLTRRKAQTTLLEPLLESISHEGAVASDSLLWADVSWEMQIEADTNRKGIIEKLFGAELDRFSTADSTGGQMTARWQDLHASLRVMLRIFRDGLKVEQLLYRDRKPEIRIFGELDRSLRTLDLLMQTYFSTRRSSTSADSSRWLRFVLQEWLALAVETSNGSHDLAAVLVRFSRLKRTIDDAVRSADFKVPFTTQGDPLRTALSRELSPRRCDLLFVSARTI